MKCCFVRAPKASVLFSAMQTRVWKMQVSAEGNVNHNFEKAKGQRNESFSIDHLISTLEGNRDEALFHKVNNKKNGEQNIFSKIWLPINKI